MLSLLHYIILVSPIIPITLLLISNTEKRRLIFRMLFSFYLLIVTMVYLFINFALSQASNTQKQVEELLSKSDNIQIFEGMEGAFISRFFSDFRMFAAYFATMIILVLLANHYSLKRNSRI